MSTDVSRLLRQARLRGSSLTTGLRLRLLDARGAPPAVPDRATGVRVCMTTYPPRVASAAQALRSILAQRRAPDGVTVVLAREQFRGQLPGPFSPLVDRGVEVLWTEPDTRSYKKLLPGLQNYPGQTIVTADDDCLYPAWWLDRLVSAHLAHPGAIIGHRGAEIPAGTPAPPYGQWRRATTLTPPARTLLTGVGGILYPPGALGVGVHDVELARALAPTADDLWFKVHALLADTPTRVTSDRPIDFPATWDNEDTAGLAATNVAEGANNRQWQALMDHYDLWDRLAAPSS